MRIVFDVDDTISRNWHRKDYSECEPITETISKINELYDAGNEIVLFTARGTISCHGDIRLAEQKNRKTLEQWLDKHGVKYTELRFGKPLADLYVDDKGISLIDFLKEDIRILGGGSGKKVEKICNVVKKELGNDTKNFKDWIEDNHGYCNHPKILSFLYDAVYMEYVRGNLACDCLTLNVLKTIIDTIDNFKNISGEYDVIEDIKILEQNYSTDADWNRLVDISIEAMKSINIEGTFCHGDTILSNIINTGKDIVFIDPRYSRLRSTYIGDFAKLRMSLDGYERRFGISLNDNTVFLEELDNYLKEAGIYEKVIVMEFMYIIRLYRYKTNVQKEEVKKMAFEHIEKFNEILGG